MQHRLFYFAPDEFRGWLPSMHPRLVTLLDVFRFAWGRPVMVSPADGAIGRRNDTESRHNIERWGRVEAIDVMPAAMERAEQAREAAETARRCGITGIGVYPHWSPRPGMHLDVRDTASPGEPAIWGALSVQRATAGQRQRGRVSGGQVYVGLAEAVGAFST